MKKRPSKAAVIFIFLFAVVNSVTLVCYLKLKDRDREIAAALRLGKKITALLRGRRELLNKDILFVRQNPAARYPVFMERQKMRFGDYGRLEAEAGAFTAGLEKTDELRRTAGRLIGLNMAFELALRACVEMTAFAPEQSFKQPCDKLARDNIVVDIARYRKRRDALSKTLAAAGPLERLLMPALPKKPPAADSRRNIIILLVDTLRADAVGSHNPASSNTPFMDRLAAEGVVYENAWSPSAGTYMSATSLFAGGNPYEINSMWDRPWSRKRSLVPLLKKAGYGTVGFSANSIVSSYNGFDRGFDRFYLRFWLPGGAVYSEIGSHFRWERRDGRPLFLYVHLIDPHAPYFAPDEEGSFAHAAAPPGFKTDIRALHHFHLDRGLRVAGALPEGNIEYLRGEYDMEARYADRWLGRIFDLLNELGLLRNSLVALTADHGEAFLEHGDVDHLHQLYEELVHVPLILWGALPEGLAPGSRVTEPHSLLELFPSLLSEQGIKLSGPAAGRANLFKPGPAPEKITAITAGHSFDMKENRHELVAVKEGKYKFIYDLTAEEWQVFDLAADPAEKNNIAARMPEFTARMKSYVKKMKEESIRANADKRRDKPTKQHLRQLKDIGYIR